MKGVTRLSSPTQKHAFLCNTFFQKQGSLRQEAIKLLLELVFNPRLLHYLYHDVCNLHRLSFMPTYVDATLLLRHFNSSVANTSRNNVSECLYSLIWSDQNDTCWSLWSLHVKWLCHLETLFLFGRNMWLQLMLY